jgi:hypothetical protein
VQEKPLYGCNAKSMNAGSNNISLKILPARPKNNATTETGIVLSDIVKPRLADVAMFSSTAIIAVVVTKPNGNIAQKRHQIDNTRVRPGILNFTLAPLFVIRQDLSPHN